MRAMVTYAETKYKEGKVKNMAGFIVEAIRSEYQDNKVEERRRKEEASKLNAAKAARRKEWEQMKDQWSAWRVAQTQAYISTMDTETLEREKAAWRASLVDNPTLAGLVRKSVEREERYFRMYVTGKLAGLGLPEWARAAGVDLAPFEELARQEEKL